ERMLNTYLRRGLGYKGIRFNDVFSRNELYNDWERFLPLLVEQLKSIRTPTGIATYDVLTAVGRGRSLSNKTKEKIIGEFIQKDAQARQGFQAAVQRYNTLPASEQETRKAKI